MFFPTVLQIQITQKNQVPMLMAPPPSRSKGLFSFLKRRWIDQTQMNNDVQYSTTSTNQTHKELLFCFSWLVGGPCEVDKQTKKLAIDPRYLFIYSIKTTSRVIDQKCHGGNKYPKPKRIVLLLSPLLFSARKCYVFPFIIFSSLKMASNNIR